LLGVQPGFSRSTEVFNNQLAGWTFWVRNCVLSLIFKDLGRLGMGAGNHEGRKAKEEILQRYE